MSSASRRHASPGAVTPVRQVRHRWRDGRSRGRIADAPSADDLLRAAENLLDKVLASQCDNRDSALDLLTVDALVTRAMMVAAGDTKTLAEFPELAMKRIAAR